MTAVTFTLPNVIFLSGVLGNILLLVWAGGRFYQGGKILHDSFTALTTSLKAITQEMAQLDKRVTILEKVESLREVGAL
jgi:hypothetical protein